MTRLSSLRISAWIALLAMVLGLLAPAVSRALAARSADAAAWTEVCSGAGVSGQALSGDAEPDASARLHRALTHCPMCALSVDKLAPPSAPFAWTGLCRFSGFALLHVHSVPAAFRQIQPPVRGPPPFQISFLV